MRKLYPLLLAAALLAACNTRSDQPAVPGTEEAPVDQPPMIGYSIVNTYPHDTSSYTQGLQFHNGQLVEGTGRYGFSKLYRGNLADGRHLQEVKLDDRYFGEGITVFNNKIYQLTWKENKVFVYDAATLKKEQEFTWPYEGWGLTSNGRELIVSTGSSNLYFVNPQDFKVIRQLNVTGPNGPVSNLNELEWADGFVYANVYLQDVIVKIDPATGKVVGYLDLEDLLKKTNKSTDARHEDVLNGIAYDSTKKVFYITGKLWPALYEIRLSK
jgi:glutamine cyclotransferase